MGKRKLLQGWFTITARFSSSCVRCNAPIGKGDTAPLVPPPRESAVLATAAGGPPRNPPIRYKRSGGQESSVELENPA